MTRLTLFCRAACGALFLLGPACASTSAAGPAPKPATKVLSTLDETVAMRIVVAPGRDVEAMTKRLAQHMAEEGRFAIVSDLDVRDELAACEQGGCERSDSDAFTTARFVVHARLNQLGKSTLVTLDVLDVNTARAVVRVSATASTPEEALDSAATKAASALRPVLQAAAAS